ncbi:disease resistance protein, partial [Striga asiatica]
ALILLLVEDLIIIRNLCHLLAYIYLKLVVQPRQHRRVRRRLTRASYSMSNRLLSQIEHMKVLVEISDRTCIEQRRMDRSTFGHLWYLLEHIGSLRNTRDIQISEEVAIFLSVLAHHKRNKFFHNVAVLRLHPILLAESTPVTDSCTDWRWRWFKANGQRRTWNVDEESALIQGLRDLVSRGWKCDNGFRSEYTNILEQHMAQCFPGTTIRAEPHISSKITVWKKTYGLILGMVGTSGFEWSETGNMIVVKEDAVWQSYIKTNPKTGLREKGHTDAVNGVLHEPSVHAPSPIPTQDLFPEHCEHPDTNMDSFSAQAGESSTSSKSKRHGKRKRNPKVEDKIIGLISSVCEETNKRLSELSSRFTNQGDAKEQRIAVYKPR